MKTFDYHLDASTLEASAAALRCVPRAAYSVPHDYPHSVRAYVAAPMVERERPQSDQLRLYIHLPFCRYHCTFCYFAVRVGASTALMQRYVRAVIKELEWIESGTPLSQLYVGGGTPTVTPPDLLDELLTAVFARTTPYGKHIHTVETSPETISAEHIAILKRHGIGRVSMGVQSLDPDVLGRVHREQTMEQALAACELLVASGLIVNIDLIYGLPGQTEEIFWADILAVAARGVPALTLYSLRTNERTPVARVLRDNERFDLGRLMRWRAFVKHCAEELGYTQTRWHTFKHMESIARTHEWLPTFNRSMSGHQLGVGMSARSQLGYTVYRNHDRLAAYVDRIESGLSPVEEVFRMTEPDRKTQFVARSLGDGRPLERSRYEEAVGCLIEHDFGEVIECLLHGGLIADDGDRLRLTETGKLLHDLVTLAFYPEHARNWLGERADRTALVQLAATPERRGC
jgi:oxygen-independent coproporphyrinogen-3 oxidase